MKVASDVLGGLKIAYVDKSIVKKLDEHKPLEDLDALNLIGGYFQQAIRLSERSYHLLILSTIIMLKRRRNQYKSLIAS